jgi:6-phosphogluconolactonase
MTSSTLWCGVRQPLLVALLSVLTLTACHGPSGCFLCGPYADNLGGTLSGLVGSRLTLQNGSTAGSQLNGPGANGTNVVFGAADFSSSYSLTIATQPTNPSQTCVVTNGAGTTSGTSNVTNIVVTCITNPPRFLYVVNRGSNNISAYNIDATSGTLTPIAGSPFPAGSLPVAMAVDSTGTYAYVVNQTDATVSAFGSIAPAARWRQ